MDLSPKFVCVYPMESAGFSSNAKMITCVCYTTFLFLTLTAKFTGGAHFDPLAFYEVPGRAVLRRIIPVQFVPEIVCVHIGPATLSAIVQRPRVITGAFPTGFKDHRGGDKREYNSKCVEKNT